MFLIIGKSTGNILGKGSYFACQAAYSANYTDCRKFFVARVIPGDYCVGSPNYTKPPPKDPQKPLENLYDSCVDQVANPNIIVIFTHYQAYPEYIVSY